MWYIKEDKKLWIKESYTPNWVDQIDIQAFTPKQIPWINDVQINSWISIES